MSLDTILEASHDAGDAKTQAHLADGKCPAPDARLLQCESIEAMDRAADELNEKDRELYRLSREGLSIGDIAKKTGRSETAIGTALSRLRTKLRAKLSRDQS